MIEECEYLLSGGTDAVCTLTVFKSLSYKKSVTSYVYPESEESAAFICAHSLERCSEHGG